MNVMQNYVSEKVRNTSNVLINPVTEETLQARLPQDWWKLLTTSEIDLAVSPNLAAVWDSALNIQASKSKKFTWSFAQVKAWIDTANATIIKTWTWMAINQTWWNLVVTTWTTAYSESIIRSIAPFYWLWIMRYAMQLSQRIANQNFVVEWTDVIWDWLSYTINSATSVTVTKAWHWFTIEDIWKGMWIWAVTTASTLTQRWVIASIPSVDTITFTVAWFPASWTGTCSLFWFNYHQVAYSGTTATTLWTWYATQRKGWTNAFTNATINTTATWHIGILETSRSFDASFLDQIPWTWTWVQATQRATSNWNVPDEDVELYLQIRVFNWTTAPASNTTMTMWFIHWEMYNPLMVNVSWVQSFAWKNALPVTLTNPPTNPTATPALQPITTAWHWTYHNLISAWSTNATSVKASAWNIWSIVLSNNSASIRYFKLYNKASAPTVWTDIPIQVYMIKGWETIDIIPGWAYWLRCTTWIAYALTWWIANNDTTAILANEVAVAISYT